MARIKTKLQTLARQRIEPGRTLDWDFLQQLGHADHIRNYLSRNMLNEAGEVIFTCQAWERALDTREPIFRELCQEFFASYRLSVQVASEDMFERNAIVFRLGGRWKLCSISEFAVWLGLYTEEEAGNPAFPIYMQLGAQGPTADTNYPAMWAEVGTGPYNGANTKASQIINAEHRILHRMISNSINQRRESLEKVSRTDLWLLYQLISPDRYTNIPFYVATFLKEATGTRQASAICGGRYVTRLARHFGLLTPRIMASLTGTEPMGFIEHNQLYGMRAIRPGTRKGTWVWYNAYPQPVAPQAQREGEGPSDTGPTEGEWDARAAYQQLDERMARMELSNADDHHRQSYQQSQHQHTLDWQQQALMQFFTHQPPPPYQPPPYQPMPNWHVDEPNPPNYDSWDAWMRRDDFQE